MKIIECFSEARTGKPSDNEDAYFINNHFAGVIDGVTNTTDQLFTNETPGRLAANTIKEAMQTLKGNEDIHGIIKSINEHLQSLFRDLNICNEVKDKPYMRPSATMAIYSKFHRKVWLIGDCQCLIDDQIYQNEVPMDEIFGKARSIVLKSELLKGKSKEELQRHDIGFEYIEPFLRSQHSFQNNLEHPSLGYSVVNGFSIPMELIEEVVVPEHIEYLCFASDGYPKVFPSLKETEEYLHKMLMNDPLCINENMSTKGLQIGNISYDDRTYVKVKI